MRASRKAEIANVITIAVSVNACGSASDMSAASVSPS